MGTSGTGGSGGGNTGNMSPMAILQQLQTQIQSGAPTPQLQQQLTQLQQMLQRQGG